jgi:hypothetical protein
MTRRVLTSLLTGLLGMSLLVGLVPSPAAGLIAAPVTYRVTTTDDQVNGATGGLSLREAVLAAAADDADSRIVLGIDATYVLDRCAPEAPDEGQQGALTVVSSLTPGSEADGFDLVVQGRGSTIEQTCAGERVWSQQAYGPLALHDLTITGGEAGGVYVASGWSIRAYDVTFAGNSSPSNGGGLLVGGGGSALLVRATFTGNDSGGDGGGVWANGSVTARESTFSANGSVDTDTGGAIYSPGSVTVLRSTLTGNVAADGAGIAAGLQVVLEAATVAGDDPGPGGKAVLSGGTFTSEASIVQPIDGNACDVVGTRTSLGYNRTSDSSCFAAPNTGDLAGQVALAPLANNGGPTQTRLPLAVAGMGQLEVVDAIPASAAAQCADNLHDQRHVDRPQGVGCEIGAVEVPNPFADVGSTNPFFAEIAWMDDAGVTTGYEDGTFKPSASVSRAAMAAFLYRLSGDSYDPPESATFPDVPTTHPFFLEVEWLEDSGITGGYLDGTFRPAAPVTRQAMAAFVYRFHEEPAFDDPTMPTFPDVSTSHEFFTEIEWMADEGISSGYVDGTWRPSVNVSRQAMARFLFVAEDVGEL